MQNVLALYYDSYKFKNYVLKIKRNYNYEVLFR